MIKKIIFGIIGLLVLIIVIAAIADGGNQGSTSQPSPSVTTQAEQQLVFDVPSLVGKNIDGVIAALGDPVDKESSDEQSKSVNEWNLTFKKDGKELLVTYEVKTGRIIDFFIGTDDPSGKTQDKERLLKLGNLKEGESGYKVEFVKAIKEPSYFTGVKIIPQ